MSKPELRVRFSCLRAIHTALLCISSSCFGQGTLHFTFDGPPSVPPGTAVFVQQYYESSMWFRPVGLVGPGNGFVRRGASPSAGWPDNGTAYIQTGLGDSLVFSFTDSALFSLRSVDLAEFSTLYQTPLTVHFVGYRGDGSIVTMDLITDGVVDGTGPVPDFQTFYFGSEFSDLARVEIPTSGWCLDNLRLSVPEPTSFSLGFVALICVALFRNGSNAKTLYRITAKLGASPVAQVTASFEATANYNSWLKIVDLTGATADLTYDATTPTGLGPWSWEWTYRDPSLTPAPLPGGTVLNNDKCTVTGITCAKQGYFIVKVKDPCDTATQEAWSYLSKQGCP